MVNDDHPCHKANRICLNSNKLYSNISDNAIIVEGKNISNYGYLNRSYLSIDDWRKLGNVHVFYIDLVDDITSGMKLKIQIKQ